MSSSARKKVFKIEPFKHPIDKMGVHNRDVMWSMLESAIVQINEQRSSGLSFEELYRNAYYMVVYKFGSFLYQGFLDVERAHLRDVAQRITQAPGDEILLLVREQWQAHVRSLRMIRDILMYLDRVYVSAHRLTPVHPAGLALWRDEVLRAPQVSGPLRERVLAAVARHRAGGQVAPSALRAITLMWEEVGRDVYAEEFEGPYLAETCAHYARESAEVLSRGDVPAYLAHAERRLAEEAARVNAYLSPSSERAVLRVAENELVERPLDTLISDPNGGLVALIAAGRTEDVRRLASLAARVPGGSDKLARAVGAHLKAQGRAAMSDPERGRDAVALVGKLLSDRDRAVALVQEAFDSDRRFHDALNGAFEAFLNEDPRSPEAVSLFADDALKRGARALGEDELEALLDRVIVLFRYLREKDVFERYYKQHLARRLLHGRTASDDAERMLLVKLKTECGYQFTSKLETMFNDVKTSRDIVARYAAEVARKRAAGGDAGPSGEPAGASFAQDASSTSRAPDSVDLNVQVLTTGSWPAPPAGSTRCVLPRELEDAMAAFGDHYLRTYSGRRLAWQTTMGTADIKAVFGGRTHELTVSTPQLAVLALFNDAERLTASEIAIATEIPPAELKRILQSLACVKGRDVLKKTPVAREVKEDDTFEFNHGFTSRMYKVRIGPVAPAREADDARAATRERVEEDRKPLLEAAIVRIMKARKTLSHNDVIAEVTAQLASRFQPQPAAIKKRLENLIEREFIERDEADHSLYRYVA